MNILVTGSHGQFGSKIVPALKDAGHEVETLDLKNGQDVRNKATVSAAMPGRDCVIHLAAIPWGMPTRSAWDYWTINVHSTALVADVAIEHRVPRMILASSTGYYGFQRGYPFGEDATTTILSPNVVQRYGLMTPYSRLPAMNATEQSRLHYMTSKVGAETALAMRAIGGEIEGIALRFAPVTPEPYEWGIWCKPELAVSVVLQMVTRELGAPFAVFNIDEFGETITDAITE